MQTTRLIFIGGFLGAGKTTLLENISQRLIARGQSVGLITNDQAPALVDTIFLSQGDKEVTEVSGSCFCCNFGGLIESIHQFRQKPLPEYILAEPVGSCTDLSATIFQPLKEQLAPPYRLSPLSVVVDAARLRALVHSQSTGLHPDAEYILIKQMEEADMIVVNKIDQIKTGEQAAFQQYLNRQYPRATAHFLSARTGEGLEQWFDAAIAGNDCGRQIIEVDYDRYAEGEAVLGWLNATMTLEGKKTDWKSFVGKLMAELGEQLDQRGAAVGHVKAIVAINGAAPIIANLTGTKETLDLRGPSIRAPKAALTINARAEMVPERLEGLVREILQSVCSSDLAIAPLVWKSLSPGRPNPTHRYTRVVGAGV